MTAEGTVGAPTCLALELLFPHYNTFVTTQVFQMTSEGTVGAPTC
jgi:hypothetical protein